MQVQSRWVVNWYFSVISPDWLLYLKLGTLPSRVLSIGVRVQNYGSGAALLYNDTHLGSDKSTSVSEHEDACLVNPMICSAALRFSSRRTRPLGILKTTSEQGFLLLEVISKNKTKRSREKEKKRYWLQF